MYDEKKEQTVNGCFDTFISQMKIKHRAHDLLQQNSCQLCSKKSLIDLVNQSSLNTRQIKGLFAAAPGCHHSEQTSGVYRERGHATNT
jgi:hypothetical protein